MNFINKPIKFPLILEKTTKFEATLVRIPKNFYRLKKLCNIKELFDRFLKYPSIIINIINIFYPAILLRLYMYCPFVI